MREPVNCGNAAAPRAGEAEASATSACAARCQPRGEPAWERSFTVRSRTATASADVQSAS